MENKTVVVFGARDEMQRYTVNEAKALGGNINAAILYHYIAGYCKSATREDGFVYLAANKIYDETAINKRKQDVAFDVLEKAGLLTKKRMYITGTNKSCLHFKTLDKTIVFANSQIDNMSNSQIDNMSNCTNQQNVELYNISSHLSNHLSNHTIRESDDSLHCRQNNSLSATDVATQRSPNPLPPSPQRANANLLDEIIKIVNPAQKATNARLRMLNARVKEYDEETVVAAAKRFARDEWRNRPENKKYKSIDYLLAPSKFSKWAEMSDDDVQESKPAFVTVING